MHWLESFLGMTNLSAPAYGFWSGFGSDIAEFAILGGVIQMYRRHNCHTKGCWRVGRHLVEGTPWCNLHHQAARAAAPAPLGELRKLIRDGHLAIHRRLDDHADLIRAGNTRKGNTDG
jgi:hypothetical protein